MAVSNGICFIFIFLQWTMWTSTVSGYSSKNAQPDGRLPKDREWFTDYKLCADLEHICSVYMKTPCFPRILWPFGTEKEEIVVEVEALLEYGGYLVKNHILTQAYATDIDIREYLQREDDRRMLILTKKTPFKYQKEWYNEKSIIKELDLQGVYNEFIERMKEDAEIIIKLR